MGKDVKIEKVEETVSAVTAFKLATKPYQAALQGEWQAMAAFYNRCPERVFDSLTVDGDTAFHIAAYSERTELLQHLLEIVPQDRVFEALSKKNGFGNTIFHEVATTNKVGAAHLLILKLQGSSRQEKARGNSMAQLRELLEYRNELGETPLYRAVAHGQTKMAKFLAKKVGNIRDHFYRDDNMSILHIALIGQHFEAATWLLGIEEKLAMEKGVNGMTCLQLLAKMPSAFKSSFRMNRMEAFLYKCLPAYPHDPDHFDDDDDNGNDDEARIRSNQMEDLETGQRTSNPRRQRKKYHFGFSRLYCAMWRALAKDWETIEKIWKMIRTHTAALVLLELLVKIDTTWASSFKAEPKTISLGRTDILGDQTEGITGPEEPREQSSITEEGGRGAVMGQRFEGQQEPNNPLLIAASEGILEIFDSILAEHPQAIEHVNRDGENILHVAISCRRREIFRRVKQMKTIMHCRLVSKIDSADYTILHHVADMKNYGEGNSSGPAVQLQEELKWLERVRKKMPSHYVMHRNKANKTADQLFRETHAELLKKAQSWTKDTSQSCSAVSVLIATVVFAAAYTVPGGSDKHGYPVFLSSPFFLFFTVMDVVSLASSLTSVVTFLSILTSPFELEDFYKSLPHKLMIGFTLLFFSVTTTMLSFTATFLLIIKLQKRKWTSTLIYTAAFLPVAVFALMQFPLYIAFTSSVQTLFKKIMRKVPILNLFPPLFKSCIPKIF